MDLSFRRIKRSLEYRFLYKLINSKRYEKLVDEDRKKAIDIMWRLTYSKPFPWDNPQTLDEKITWLSGMSDTSKWTKYADKYEVRKYVEEQGLKDILTECYGVWTSVDEIDYDSLPHSFVIKCTHDSGSTVVVRDKDTMDRNAVNAFLREKLKHRMGYLTCEPHYTSIKPRIMAEELIQFNPDGFSKSLVDYKFWVFNGKAFWAFICYDREVGIDAGEGYHVVYDLFDLKTWQPTRQYISEKFRNVAFKDVPRPKNLDKMIEYAEKLSEGMPLVRVDFYNIDGKIYFGELTFTSNGGRNEFYTQEFQLLAGHAVDISNVLVHC